MRELPQPKPDDFAGSLGEGASGETVHFAIQPETVPPCQKPNPLRLTLFASSPEGGAGEQSESERVRFAGISPILSIDNRAKLAYITIVNTN